MTQISNARGNATRQANKALRKEMLLSIAREIISNNGFEAFTINELASKAQLSIPTVHNLLGKKSDIFEQLVVEMVAKVEVALAQPNVHDPIVATEAFIDSLLDLFAANEAFYKAAFVAGERTQFFDHELPNGIFNKSLAIATQVCVDAKNNGFLKGQVDVAWLAKQLFGCQRLARHDWVNGYISLAEYRVQVLIGAFITLAADATPSFQERLYEVIKSLTDTPL